MSGRPKGLGRYKHHKLCHVAGRHEERLDKLRAKQQKVEMLESLLTMHKELPNPDTDYVSELSRRVNEQRSQLRVLSTVEFKERP